MLLCLNSFATDLHRLTNEFRTKTPQMSFQQALDKPGQAPHVGNPSENKERFRTSRNDKVRQDVALLMTALVKVISENLRNEK